MKKNHCRADNFSRGDRRYPNPDPEAFQSSGPQPLLRRSARAVVPKKLLQKHIQNHFLSLQIFLKRPKKIDGILVQNQYISPSKGAGFKVGGPNDRKRR